MLGQSRQLKVLVDTHNAWVDLYQKLKRLKEEKIGSADIDL